MMSVTDGVAAQSSTARIQSSGAFSGSTGRLRGSASDSVIYQNNQYLVDELFMDAAAAEYCGQ